jgi:uncharacterized membrane-anchored protein
LCFWFSAVGGCVVVPCGGGGPGSAREAESRFSLQNETFRLILGILSAVTGLLKLLSPVQGDIPVVGDILPAISGLVSGFILLFDYYHGRSFFEEDDSRMTQIITVNRKWVGFVAMVIALLHFIFPGALLL